MTDASTHPDIRSAFLLGASLGELLGRIEVAALNPTLGTLDISSEQPELAADAFRASFLPYVKAGSDVAWLTSMWRVLFQRLSQLHSAFFPNSTTQYTRYDPGVSLPPYLFPANPPDYANFGIAPQPENNLILQDFRLHEATRRALNCLTLLYIEPRVSLIPEILAEQQQLLIDAVPIPAADDASAQPPPANAQERRARTVSILTGTLLLFLRAWEGFLRESFYTAGASMQDQLHLIAFEAGLDMASLSWQITIESKAPQPAATAAAEAARLSGIWTTAFADDRISRLQYQIAMLGKALDEAETASSVGATVAEPGPAQVAIQAVRRSLDYWQRAIVFLNTQPADGPHGPVTAADWDRLRINLIEQVATWQAIVLGQQDLESYTSPSVGQRILEDLAVKFQALVVGEGLFGAADDVGKALVAEVQLATDQMRAASQVVGRAAQAELSEVIGALLRSLWPIVAVLTLVFLLGIVILVQHASSGQTSSLGADIATPLLGLTGAVGLFVSHRQAQASPANGAVAGQVSSPPATATAGMSTTVVSPVSLAGAGAGAVPSAVAPSLASQLTNGTLTFAGRLGTLASQVSSSMLADFSKGMDRAQADLKKLGYAVGLSYPLIEYFVLDSSWGNIRADVHFMDVVIWNDTQRREEIESLVSAAFGPLGIFAMAAGTGRNPPAAPG